MAKGTKSKAHIVKKLPKIANESLDWDNKTANIGNIRRIVDASQQEEEFIKSQKTLPDDMQKHIDDNFMSLI